MEWWPKEVAMRPGKIQEILRNYNIKDVLVYHTEGRLYHVSDLNNWIYIIHWYKKREWRGKLGRKIMSSVLDILNFRYLNTSLICECEQQMLRYIGLTFTRVSWLEAQARYLQLSCHRNLKVRFKKSCQKNRRKLSGGRCHRSQQNPSR